MNEQADVPTTSRCPRCGAEMTATTVRTTFWKDDRLAVVEDIPAHVCSSCVEQFYDQDVSDALRELAEDGFPAASAEREIRVPVFSLRGRIRRRTPLPDDVYID
jgi:YgiT-type zinc finger domain-containing protein